MEAIMALVLSLGQATYHVKYTFKKVEATSKEVKGKINCSQEECEFLLAVPIKSFESSDSNRDLNMQETTQADKYPIATAKGKFPREVLTQANATIQAIVEFHGVSQSYPVKLTDKAQKAKLVLNLDNHKIIRPSLFGIKIQNEIPVDFDLKWVEEKK